MPRHYRLKDALIRNNKIKAYLHSPTILKEYKPWRQIKVTCKYVQTLAKAIVDSKESGYEIIDALYWLTGWRRKTEWMLARKINAVKKLSKISDARRNEVIDAVNRYHVGEEILLGRWGIGKVVLSGLRNRTNILMFKDLLKALIYEKDVTTVDQSIDNFAKKRITDVTVGTISPILYCLQPTLCPVLNNKTYSFFDILSSEKHTHDLRDYTTMAKVVREFRNSYDLQADLCFFDYMGVDYSEGEREISNLFKKEIKKYNQQKDEYFDDPSEPEITEREGKLLLRKHLAKERSTRLILAFKRSLISYNCSVCGFNFEKTYGSLGARFIEAHHKKAVYALKEDEQISTKDLVAVCSNCHRIIHRQTPPLDWKKLKKIIKKRK